MWEVRPALRQISGMSAVYRTYNSGPKQEPCGIPQTTGYHDDRSVPTRIEQDLSWSKPLDSPALNSKGRCQSLNQYVEINGIERRGNVE